MIKAIDFAYKGALVRRFHTYNVLRYETVGHHSHGVAYLIDILYPDARKELLSAALRHDLAEGGSAVHGGTGDIPSHIKQFVPGIRSELKKIEDRDLAEVDLSMPELTEGEQRRLKFADRVHGALYCLEEISRGNDCLKQPLSWYLDTIRELPGTSEDQEIAMVDELVHRATMEGVYEV